MFDLLATDPRSKARRGRLTTPHGVVDTPAFIPVGTQGSVKAVSSRELRELDAQIILGNTYHLFVRPGLEVIRHFGGLHKFMNWNGPILTDSGGFQIFSLAKLRKITEEGVHFQNHVDGTPAFISPEIAMEIQSTLGSDIAMVLDECPPWPCEYEYAARSMEMTARWARRCKKWQKENTEHRTSNAEHRRTDDESINHEPSTLNPLLFGIVQGATFPELRKQSALAAVEIGFDGYAIGGVSVGEPEEEMMRGVESSAPFLPEDKPRYAMGLGTPPQLVELIARGMDLFDCVLPTRVARNGTAFTNKGTVSVKAGFNKADFRSLEEGCECFACRHFTRAYLRHLLNVNEILGLRMVSVHNSHMYLKLMADVRAHLAAGTFGEFRREFVARYAPTQKVLLARANAER